MTQLGAPSTHTTVRTLVPDELSASSVHELETVVRVTAKRLAADGVVSLELSPADGSELPPWGPGAHVDLIVDGVAERQYSLCGDPRDRTCYRLGVLRDEAGRGSSVHVHDILAVGDEIRVRGPRNNFVLRPSPRYLFVAGGIGITPILPMIRSADAAGAEWRLLYGGRQRASMAFLDELAAYGERVLVCPQDEEGLLDLGSYLGVVQAETRIYCCGPEPLLAAVEVLCETWPPHTLEVERFSPRPLSDAPTATGFEVVLEQSGRTLTVPPEKSILEVVRAAGVGVLSSCEEGTCGTCETAVIEGRVDHRDSLLDDEEREANDCMMICVSRALDDRLVLDL